MADKVNRCADASVFGWDFQINSAIYLFLKNIDDISRIKVEGEKEDIELYLDNEKKIYAQVKGVQDPYDDKNLKAKLDKAIQTLNEACDSNSKLIYY